MTGLAHHNAAQRTRADSLGIVERIVSTRPTPERRNVTRRRFAMQATVRRLLPDRATAECLRTPFASLVPVYHHHEHQTASYGGLHTCGNVHICPVCGAKIAQRRTEEVNAGATAWLDRGGSLIMATFTLQHTAGDSLGELAGALNEAYRKIRGGRKWKRFAEKYGLVGTITAREYTHGEHGWHPHLHALFFVRGGPSWHALQQFERWLKEQWGAALEQLGRFAHPVHGLKCQLSEDGALAEYVAKSGKGWTVGDELAKANSKKAKKGGRSIGQLLEAAGAGDDEAGALFVEYANWTYRKNALCWTPGLRALLGLQEKTDEEIAAEESAEGRILVQFTRKQWRTLLWLDKLEPTLRADILVVASAGDGLAVADFVHQFGIELESWQIDPPATPHERDAVAPALPLVCHTGQALSPAVAVAHLAAEMLHTESRGLPSDSEARSAPLPVCGD